MRDLDEEEAPQVLQPMEHRLGHNDMVTTHGTTQSCNIPQNFKKYAQKCNHTARSVLAIQCLCFI